MTSKSRVYPRAVATINHTQMLLYLTHANDAQVRRLSLTIPCNVPLDSEHVLANLGGARPLPDGAPGIVYSTERFLVAYAHDGASGSTEMLLHRNRAAINAVLASMAGPVTVTAVQLRSKRAWARLIIWAWATAPTYAALRDLLQPLLHKPAGKTQSYMAAHYEQLAAFCSSVPTAIYGIGAGSQLALVQQIGLKFACTYLGLTVGPADAVCEHRFFRWFAAAAGGGSAGSAYTPPWLWAYVQGPMMIDATTFPGEVSQLTNLPDAYALALYWLAYAVIVRRNADSTVGCTLSKDVIFALAKHGNPTVAMAGLNCIGEKNLDAEWGMAEGRRHAWRTGQHTTKMLCTWDNHTDRPGCPIGPAGVLPREMVVQFPSGINPPAFTAPGLSAIAAAATAGEGYDGDDASCFSGTWVRRVAVALDNKMPPKYIGNFICMIAATPAIQAACTLQGVVAGLHGSTLPSSAALALVLDAVGGVGPVGTAGRNLEEFGIAGTVPEVMASTVLPGATPELLADFLSRLPSTFVLHNDDDRFAAIVARLKALGSVCVVMLNAARSKEGAFRQEFPQDDRTTPDALIVQASPETTPVSSVAVVCIAVLHQTAVDHHGAGPYGVARVCASVLRVLRNLAPLNVPWLLTAAMALVANVLVDQWNHNISAFAVTVPASHDKSVAIRTFCELMNPSNQRVARLLGSPSMVYPRGTSYHGALIAQCNTLANHHPAIDDPLEDLLSDAHLDRFAGEYVRAPSFVTVAVFAVCSVRLPKQVPKQLPYMPMELVQLIVEMAIAADVGRALRPGEMGWPATLQIRAFRKVSNELVSRLEELKGGAV